MTAVGAPFQWALYVRNHPDMGRPFLGSADSPISASDLSLVNADVNRRIKPGEGMPDVLLGWEEDRSPGWCGDYAVTKRALLIRLGWPSARVLIAEVIIATGEHHAVVVADGVVLDNRVDVMRPPLKTGYRGIRIQQTDDPNFWTDASGVFR